MPPIKPPHLPNESAAAYIARTTAMEGVPILPVVYQEHSFWVSLSNIVKRWQTMMGIVAIVATTSFTTTKANKLIDEVGVANEKLKKLDEVVTQKQLADSLDSLAERCSERAAKISLRDLQTPRYVVRLPNYPTRGKPADGHIVDLKENAVTREQ